MNNTAQVRDVFEPHHEPAKSLYLAFQAEASHRKGRGVEAWKKAELDAVHRECQHQAERLGLRSLTLDEMMRAERYAMGSVDYGAQWAYQLVRMMHSQPRPANLL